MKGKFIGGLLFLATVAFAQTDANANRIDLWNAPKAVYWQGQAEIGLVSANISKGWAYSKQTLALSKMQEATNALKLDKYKNLTLAKKKEFLNHCRAGLADVLNANNKYSAARVDTKQGILSLGVGTLANTWAGVHTHCKGSSDKFSSASTKFGQAQTKYNQAKQHFNDALNLLP